MSDKPSYLGLLNAIAVAEGHAHEYLTAWADTTKSADVRAVLLKIAAREGEHAMSFGRRVNELGYEVRYPEDEDNAAKSKAIVTSDCSDLEKMEALKLHRLDTGDQPDIFDGFFKDHSIDIDTGALLGRYIAEERDSARLFKQCHALLRQAASAAAPGGGDDRLASLERKVDTLCATVDQLCAAVSATESGSNGSRTKARVK
jgi:rubrerythrin